MTEVLKIDLGLGDEPKNHRVVVAMSGGVDSSVTAALLAESGYEVIGITLQLYDDGVAKNKPNSCCAGQDIHDARRIASHIGIPHYVLNYQDLFKEAVIDDFADSYLRGETPLPCVRCNERVKFQDLLTASKDLGAEALVTGHYIRRYEGPSGPELHAAIDPIRDQSYFLFATKQSQLSDLRFPLGEFPKTVIREQAERLGLSVAKKPDSQDICFVPGGNYREVIEKLRPGACDPGVIINSNGEQIGKHQGTINFTIGQRKGLGVSASEPLYVTRIDSEKNIVFVGNKNELLANRILVEDVNWLAKDDLAENKTITVRIRSTHEGSTAKINWLNSNVFEVFLDHSELATSAGQGCVVYDNSRLLGGGWITNMGRC